MATAMQTIGSSHWVGCYKKMPSAKVRIYAFYGAGGSAAMFRPWLPILEKEFPEVELCVLEYPGHGDHESELFDNADDLMKQFNAEIIQAAGGISHWFNAPFALLGASTGGRFAFGFLSELIKISVRPEKLYIVGRTPPIVYDAKWVDEQPKGTLPLLNWVSDELATSQAERLKRAWTILPEDELTKREALWRADLHVNCGRIAPNPRSWQMVAKDGKVMKKTSPESQKIIAVAKKGVVATTGKEFVGKSGGKWVEIDMEKDKGKPGWLLTHGRSIGMDAPMLEAVEEVREPSPDDVFWKSPVGVQVHWSTGDQIQPWEDPSGRLAPTRDWIKLAENEPEYVKHEGLLHDQLLTHEDVLRHICKDLIQLLRLR